MSPTYSSPSSSTSITSMNPTTSPTAIKIDVHHHTIPDFYRTALKESPISGVSGAGSLAWSVEMSLSLMDKLNIQTSILSLSAPGAPGVGGHIPSSHIARQWNEYSHSLRTAHPTRFGFFAAMPNLADTEDTLIEIEYALDVLKADGITLFTSYDGKYLGHTNFKPIWAELNKRNAVNFIHPCHAPSATWASPALPPPMIDYPHETTRTACDLITSGRKRQNSNCKIILSHGGGTLPYLAWRLETTCMTLFKNEQTEESPPSDQIVADAKTFYFDLALSGSRNVLDTLLKWAPEDRVLYGSDFPYATDAAEWSDKELREYEIEDGLRRKIYRGNAMVLFPRLQDLGEKGAEGTE